MSDAAPVTPVAPTTPAAPQGGATPPNAGAKPATPPTGAKPTAPAPEQEVTIKGKKYTLSQLEGIVPRGENSAQLMSAAAKKAQEAEARIAEADRRDAVFKSGDRKAIFAELQKLGHNPYTMSVEQVKEAIADEQLTPEQKRVRELEEKLTAKERAEKEQSEKQAEEVRAAEVEKITNSLAQTFVDALHSKGIPLTHARVLLPHYSQLVEAYEAAGMEPPMDTIAEHLAEVDSGAFNRNLGSMEVPAILERLGPEKARALVNYAVSQYKAQKAGNVPGGVLPGAPPPKPQVAGSLPSWVSTAPPSVRNAYFQSDENHPDVKAYLAKQQKR